MGRGLFDTPAAARWSPATLDRRIRSYGTFLHFAHRRGELNPSVRPAARANGGLLEAYARHLEKHVAPETIATLFNGLVAMLRVIDPGGSSNQVEALAKYYARVAMPSRDKRKILVGASQLYDAGINRMRAVWEPATRDRIAAVCFGDGLMMAMLAAKPMRLKNVVGTQVGVHFLRTASGTFEWRFGKKDTKGRKRSQAEMPPSLLPFFDHWLSNVRPFLLEGRIHDAMWVTTLGDPMARTTVYGRFCKATREELGVRINPHATRDIAATSIAVSMPQDVRMIPFILDNDDRTAQEHYNLADSLSASKYYLERLELRRRQAFCKKPCKE